MGLHEFQITFLFSGDQAQKSAVPFLLKYHLQEGLKYFEVQIQSNRAEYVSFEIVEKYASNFGIHIIAEFMNLVHFTHPLFLNERKTFQELFVVGIIGRVESIQNIAQAYVKLLVNRSQGF